jgi:hypothetical protein
MKTITYESAETQDETVSALLMMFLEYGTEIGLFMLLGTLVKVKMKTVIYGVLNKAQTVIVSLVMGCRHTKAINEVLADETVAANYLGMSRFPDQSQINRYLTRFSEENVAELGAVHQALFIKQSQARQAVGPVVVDIDPCGLVVNGQTYEWARKGYFPRKRGEIGYPLSVAYIGAYEEAVQLYLDPGNSHCGSRLKDLLRDLDLSLTKDNPGLCLIRRLDGGYDSAENRLFLADLPGYFILKGGHSATAKRLARTVTDTQWLPIAENVHGVELAPEGTVRRVLFEFWLPDGQPDYSLLYTTLPAHQWSIARAFAFYNERTTIEAFFAQSRHVFNIQSMRSRQFNAIFAFLRFVFLTHNVLVWAKHSRLADSDFAHSSTRELLHQVPRIRARVTWDGLWHIWIIGASRWASALRNALSREPRLVQLAFPFARLYKT